MAQDKTIWDHMNDFYDGIKSTPEALYFFGDYLARVSGFRDWQRDHESVLPIDYVEQSNAVAETQVVYDVLSTTTGRELIFDALKHDTENRPAYYLANILSSAGIAKVLNKALASTSIVALKTTGITTNLTHQVIEQIKKEANLSDKEFNQLLNDDILKKKIDEEMGYYINDLYNNFNQNVGNSDGSDSGSNNGNGHKPPYDPNKGGMQDPLVLDSDKDGFISTVSLQDSQAYFDITGDGIKEKTGWIAPNDGILVYDKNENGKIDGIDEVFGNATTSGFTELAQTADTNFDGKIDRKDELYNRLKVWHDDNGDGISQSEELHTLKSEGVNAIELNVVGTNIDVNGNRISEAGRYQDTQGNRELAADVELQYKNKLEDKPSVTAADFTTIDPITKSLANLRGYGYVANTFEVYNTNEAFKALAKVYANDSTKTAEDFNSSINTIQEKSFKITLMKNITI